MVFSTAVAVLTLASFRKQVHFSQQTISPWQRPKYAAGHRSTGHDMKHTSNTSTPGSGVCEYPETLSTSLPHWMSLTYRVHHYLTGCHWHREYIITSLDVTDIGSTSLPHWMSLTYGVHHYLTACHWHVEHIITSLHVTDMWSISLWVIP